MSFKAIKGKWGLRWYPKTASTAYAKDTLMAMDNSTGYLIAASSTTDFNIGILRKAIAATDSDYASNTKVPVEVPTSMACEMEGTVSTGTLVATSVGKYFDLTDAAGVNQSASSNKAVLCTGFISATLGRFVLNAHAFTRNAA